MKKRIFYTGTGNLRNNGEYAMVAGLTQALIAQKKDMEFYILTKKPEENQAIIGSLPIKTVKEFWFQRRSNKVFYLMTIALNLLVVFVRRLLPIKIRNQTLSALSGTDIVVDLSGDAVSTDYGEIALYERLYFIVLARAAGKKIILLAQTIGPFKTRLSKIASRIILSLATRIVLREKKSMGRLEELKKNWPNLDPNGTDNAFLLPPDKDGAQELIEKEQLDIDWTRSIGLSPSRIIYKWFPDAQDDSTAKERYITALADMVDTISQNYTVVFVPHVVSSNYNNDLELCREIRQKLKHPERTAIINNYYNAAVLKALMARLQFVIALRMHAAIGALSVGRPAICWSYNDKFEGIIGDKLELTDMVIDIRKLNMPDCVRAVFDAIAGLEAEGINKAAARVKQKSDAARKHASRNVDLVMSFLEQ